MPYLVEAAIGSVNGLSLTSLVPRKEREGNSPPAASSKQRFEILRKLGSGTYGKVSLAYDHNMQMEVAVKLIKKSAIENKQDLLRIRREIRIMSALHHPDIIQIYEVFENRDKIIIIMEYASNGEVYDYVSRHGSLHESEARRLFRQIVSAVLYCHKHGVAHRDLKLENILLDVNGSAKIADFGLSNYFSEGKLLRTFCGSPLYASPEIINGTPYKGPEVDCWSLGVLLYTLVYGTMPFDGRDFNRMVRQIKRGAYYEPETPSTASMLIRNMLRVEPKRRATIHEIASHWWLNLDETLPVIHELPENQVIDPTPLQQRAETVVVQNLAEETDVFMEFGHLSAATRKKIEDFRRRRLEAERYIDEAPIGPGKRARRPEDWCLATFSSKDEEEEAPDVRSVSCVRPTKADQVAEKTNVAGQSGSSTPTPTVGFSDPLNKLRELESRLQGQVSDMRKATEEKLQKLSADRSSPPRTYQAPSGRAAKEATPIREAADAPVTPTMTKAKRKYSDELGGLEPPKQQQQSPAFVSLDQSANYEQRPSPRWKLELDSLNMLMNQLLEEADKGRISLNLVARIKQCPGYNTRPLVKELLEAILLQHQQPTRPPAPSGVTSSTATPVEEVATDTVESSQPPLQPPKTYRQVDIEDRTLQPPENEDENVTMVTTSIEGETSDFEELESVLDEEAEDEDRFNDSDDTSRSFMTADTGTPTNELPESSEELPSCQPTEDPPASAPAFFDRGLHRRQSRGKYACHVDVFMRGLSAEERNERDRRPPVGGAQPGPADAPFLFDKAKEYILKFPEVTPSDEQHPLLLLVDGQRKSASGQATPRADNSPTPTSKPAADDDDKDQLDKGRTTAATLVEKRAKSEGDSDSTEMEEDDEEEGEQENEDDDEEEDCEEESGDEQEGRTKAQNTDKIEAALSERAVVPAAAERRQVEAGYEKPFQLAPPPKGRNSTVRNDEVASPLGAGQSAEVELKSNAAAAVSRLPVYVDASQTGSAARRRRLRERRHRIRTGDDTFFPMFARSLDELEDSRDLENETTSAELEALLSPRLFPASPNTSPPLEASAVDAKRLFADPRRDPSGSYSNAVNYRSKDKASPTGFGSSRKDETSSGGQSSGAETRLAPTATSDPFYDYFSRHAPSISAGFSYLSSGRYNNRPLSPTRTATAEERFRNKSKSVHELSPLADSGRLHSLAEPYDAAEAAERLEVYKPRFCHTSIYASRSESADEAESNTTRGQRPLTRTTVQSHHSAVPPTSSSITSTTSTSPYSLSPYYRPATPTYLHDRLTATEAVGRVVPHYRSLYDENVSYRRSPYDVDGATALPQPTEVVAPPSSRRFLPWNAGRLSWLRSQSVEKNDHRLDNYVRSTPANSAFEPASANANTYATARTSDGGEPAKSILKSSQRSSIDSYSENGGSQSMADGGSSAVTASPAVGIDASTSRVRPSSSAWRFMNKIRRHLSSEKMGNEPFERSTVSRYTHPPSTSVTPTYWTPTVVQGQEDGGGRSKKRSLLNLGRRRTAEVNAATVRAAADASVGHASDEVSKRPSSPLEKIKGFFRRGNSKEAGSRYSTASSAPTATSSAYAPQPTSYRKFYQSPYRPQTYVPITGAKYWHEGTTLY